MNENYINNLLHNNNHIITNLQERQQRNNQEIQNLLRRISNLRERQIEIEDIDLDESLFENFLSNKRGFFKERDGYDERYPKENNEELLLIKVNKNFYLQKLLNQLNNPDITVIQKIQLIENEYPRNQIKPYNIMNGGLLDDFNFEID